MKLLLKKIEERIIIEKTTETNLKTLGEQTISDILNKLTIK